MREFLKQLAAFALVMILAALTTVLGILLSEKLITLTKEFQSDGVTYQCTPKKP